VKNEPVGMGDHELVPARVLRGVDIDDPEVHGRRSGGIRSQRLKL
jgi:hypothetical protein